jgi:hypothetical protein
MIDIIPGKFEILTPASLFHQFLNSLRNTRDKARVSNTPLPLQGIPDRASFFHQNELTA